ncbi:MAG: YpmA family protein [Tepidanaerobacteraceae bacterium]|jgi:uncharacterized FlaG/YvyC family protein|nr:YpmA family protein [Tepidanaerobacteraceae bacterium]
MKENKLELIAKKELRYSDELYQLVDFLNKNLKNRGVIFGISKEGERAIVSIYEI